MNLSKQIKALRENAKLSQEELAEKIYVSRQTISNWENEKSYPDVHNLLLLSVLFTVTLDDLVKGDYAMMKQETEKKKYLFWNWCLLILFIAAPVSMAPMLKYFGLWGLLLPLVLILLLAIATAMVLRMQKKNQLDTYAEIIAYIDSQQVDVKKSEREKKHKQEKETVFAIIAEIALIWASFLIFY